MKLVLDFRKSVEENAAEFFEKSKKAKKKLAGAEKAIVKTRERYEKAKKKEVVVEKKSLKKVRKREWFEKFRWFKSSDDILVIGGRDATTNELVIKKHTDPKDMVLHTDMAGSPFVVIKSNGEVPDKTLQEATDFTADYSKGWKKGMSTLEVFYVNPDQVTKEAQAGEFLPKGAFMIRGKTNYLQPKMNLAVGVGKDGLVMGGPLEAVKKHCKDYVVVKQGDEKISDVAKKIYKKIGGDLDDIIRVLPPGSKV